MWGWLTANRTGMSSYTDNVFYSKDMDFNYQVGLRWTRLGIGSIITPMALGHRRSLGASEQFSSRAKSPTPALLACHSGNSN